MPSSCAVDNDGAITVSEVIVVAEDDLMEIFELSGIFFHFLAMRCAGIILSFNAFQKSTTKVDPYIENVTYFLLV